MDDILTKLLQKVAENHSQMEVMINEFNATSDGIMLTVEESENLRSNSKLQSNQLLSPNF